MNNKNIFHRFTIGVKKGFTTPTLPQNISKFQTYPIVRILRFIGGVSFIFILSKTYTNFPIYYLYLALCLAFIFTIYQFVLTFYRIKFIIRQLKSGELDVRNSPLDRFSTLGAKIVFCLKGACEVAQPVGLTLGLMLGTDEIFKSAGREAIFAPFLGGTLNIILPQQTNEAQNIQAHISKQLKNLSDNKISRQAFELLLTGLQDSQIAGDLSVTEAADFASTINEVIKDSLTSDMDIKNDIQQRLSEINNSKK